MKLIPASSAVWMMRIDSSWSGLPHAPNIMAPRHRGPTFRPVRPSVRVSMTATLRPCQPVGFRHNWRLRPAAAGRSGGEGMDDVDHLAVVPIVPLGLAGQPQML